MGIINIGYDRVFLPDNPGANRKTANYSLENARYIDPTSLAVPLPFNVA